MSTRLDPVGRLQLPRRSTTIRMALVALLLLTAAGVLYAGPGKPDATTSGPEPAATWTPPPTPAGDRDRLPIPDGMVGVPVPLTEPTVLAVLRAGDRVDLLAVPPSGDALIAVAGDAAVLAVDHAAGAVLLSLTPEQAEEVVLTPAATGFAVIVQP